MADWESRTEPVILPPTVTFEVPYYGGTLVIQSSQINRVKAAVEVAQAYRAFVIEIDKKENT